MYVKCGKEELINLFFAGKMFVDRSPNFTVMYCSGF